MKPSVRSPFIGAAIACFFTLTLAALAQQKAPPATTPETPPPAETPPPPPTPAAAPAAEPGLRRLDDPPVEKSDDAPAPGKKSKKSRAQQNRERIKEAQQHAQERADASTGDALVNVFADSYLGKDQKTDAVVAVFGNATSEGEVAHAVVSVFGDNRVTGPVHGAVVAIFGDTYVNSSVVEGVVAIFGDVRFGPEARIDGEVVCIGGDITRDAGSVVRNGVKNIFATKVVGLKAWFRACFAKGRLLASGEHLTWAWVVAFSLLGFYALLALLFGPGVEKCVFTLERSPGFSVLSALLAVLIAPVLLALLAVTGFGIVAVPFLVAALLMAALFGKVAMLGWLGRRITVLLGPGVLNHVAVAVVLGGLILIALYTVPVLGGLLFLLSSWIGLGVVVYALALGIKRERTPAAPAEPVATETPPAEPPPVAPVSAPAPSLAPAFSAATLPRAGFRLRLSAMVVDFILMGVVGGNLAHGGPFLLPVLATYAAVMWKFKGTTIGGIICGLKVVRLDDRPLDWPTAIVRALGCFLSMAAMGLGFLWVTLDDEKQSWHDKIAGTTVVRMPKGVSLL
jgi:uncharacterized RDD family membrane protein YckC